MDKLTIFSVVELQPDNVASSNSGSRKETILFVGLKSVFYDDNVDITANGMIR